MCRARTCRMSASRCGSMVRPTIFVGSMRNRSDGGSTTRTIGTLAVL